MRVLLDTSGDALADALAGPALPWAIKPNRDELAEWAGQPLNTVRHIAAQAQRLREQGLGLVAVSMGEQGALFATEHGVLHAQLPATAVTSTVGAGDAMVAGIAAALAEQADTERVARLAVAFAVAKLGLAGPTCPRRPSSPNWPSACRCGPSRLRETKHEQDLDSHRGRRQCGRRRAERGPAQGGHGTRLGLRYRNPQRRRHAQAYAGAAPKPGDVLLLIGGAQPAPQAGLARGVAGLDEALAAPDRSDRAGQARTPAPAPNASLPSRPAPPASPILSWRPRV